MNRISTIAHCLVRSLAVGWVEVRNPTFAGDYAIANIARIVEFEGRSPLL
jgi:hypothetical protein